MTIFPNVNDVQMVPQRGPGFFPHQPRGVFFEVGELALAGKTPSKEDPF